MEVKFFDFFSGIGGFHYATQISKLKEVSFIPVGYCEIDTVCKKVFNEYFKDLFFISDIKNVKNKTLPEFDLLFAGFPCQSFSNVGNRQEFKDPRGNLFFEIVDILKQYKPKFFILENVQKIKTIRNGEILFLMVAALEAADYQVHLYDLYANHYGLPQKRRRLFFCGVNKSFHKDKINLPPPPIIPQNMWKYPTSWHLLERNVSEEYFIPKGTRKTILTPNPKWMGDLDIDKPIARPITATMGKWHRANQDNYYSLTYISKDNPDPYKSPLVDLDKELIRRITPLEGFRLQGFPDEFFDIVRKLKISNTASYRVIGNAVPVDLARSVIDHFIGNYIKEINKK